MARYAVTGAASMSGTFSSDRATLTFPRSGDYTLTVWPDGNGNSTADNLEQPRRMKVQVIDLGALLAIDLKKLNTAIDPGSPTMTIKAAGNSNTTIALLADFAPLTTSTLSVVRWTLEENGRVLDSGDFSSLLPTFSLSRQPNHTYLIKAYVDANRNGVLDAGEATRTITVKVAK
jgi:hypothetical protein